MKLMIKDPRTGNPATIHNGTAYWDERGKVGVCEHTDTDIRVFTYRNGALAVCDQCLRCGKRLGNPKGGVDRTSLKPADDTLIDRWEHGVRTSLRAIDIKHIDAGRAMNAEWNKSYQEYLLSPAWRRRRELVLRRCGGVCEGCGEAPATEVHHMTYRHVFEEFLFELKGLCEPCHDRWHGGDDEPVQE